MHAFSSLSIPKDLLDGIRLNLESYQKCGSDPRSVEELKMLKNKLLQLQSHFNTNAFDELFRASNQKIEMIAKRNPQFRQSIQETLVNDNTNGNLPFTQPVPNMQHVNKPQKQPRASQQNLIPRQDSRGRSKLKPDGPAKRDNSLDVWERSQVFFGPIPDRKMIDEMFASALPKERPPIRIETHWITKMRNAVFLTRKTERRHIESPPPENPSPNSIAQFWVGRSLPFQIDKSQKNYQNLTQNLLSAFVFVQNDEKTDIKGPKTESKRKLKMLAPRIGYHPYLQLTYEERLKTELEALELLPGEGEAESTSNSLMKMNHELDSEINASKEEILKYKNMIFENLEKYQKKVEESQKIHRRYEDWVRTHPPPITE